MSKFSTHQQIRAAEQLYYVLKDIVSDELGCLATVSLAVCVEIVTHHLRDLDRLYAVHQKLVHPSKHIAYIAFWVRKLKPIDSAFALERIADGEPLSIKDEVTDVNERAAIYYAIRLLDSYIRDGHIEPCANVSASRFAEIMSDIVDEYFNDEIRRVSELGKRREALVYDMRYRTFGPHHFVYVLNHLLHEAVAFAQKEENNAA